jgi:arylsulfatase A-like enzyme
VSRRPNIPLLWTNEQRADTLAAYGNRSDVTPCLDRLAREATVFRHAYCASPVCTPARDIVRVWRRDDDADNDNRPEGKDAAWSRLGDRNTLERALRGESRRLVTSDRWKLILSDQGEGELYDLTADPLELNNRAADTAVAARRRDLESRLRAWQARMGDPWLARDPRLCASRE